MQLVRTIWVINFFLFSLTLLFVWSKTIIITKRVARIVPLLKRVKEMRNRLSTGADTQQKPA